MTESSNQPAIVPKGTPLPPPAPGVRHVTVPLIGIIISNDERRRHVDRLFHWPMIVLSLAILPLLLVEFFRRPTGGLGVAVSVGFVVIWLAFVVEFFIKITIAESRLEYVRRNWLDVVIILVPVLRPFRATSIVRTTRVFKLRGVAMKGARYVFTLVLGLEATERLLLRFGLKVRTGAKDPDQMTRHELIRDLKRLRRLIDRWDAWYDAHETHVAEKGGACYIEVRPAEPAKRRGDESTDAASPDGSDGDAVPSL